MLTSTLFRVDRSTKKCCGQLWTVLKLTLQMCCASSKTFRVDRNTFRFSDQCPRVNIWVKMLSEQCCGCGMLWLLRKLVSGSRSNSRTHAWSSENVLACSTSRSSYAHGRSSTVLSTWYDDYEHLLSSASVSVSVLRVCQSAPQTCCCWGRRLWYIASVPRRPASQTDRRSQTVLIREHSGMRRIYSRN